MDGLLLPVGGFICGCVAGFAAQYGRLCTVGAIEDALMGGDFRRASAWGLAAAIAILLTQALVFAEALDLSATHYVQSRLDLFGLVVGGLLFGLGAALVGTCAFGLLVRVGTGDLRAHRVGDHPGTGGVCSDRRHPQPDPRRASPNSVRSTRPASAARR